MRDARDYLSTGMPLNAIPRLRFYDTLTTADSCTFLLPFDHPSAKLIRPGNSWPPQINYQINSTNNFSDGCKPASLIRNRLGAFASSRPHANLPECDGR